MAQPQQNLTVAAPAFKGMNTEDSPLTLGAEWASIAHNCVIDQYGRLGARKGYSVLTTDNTALGTDPLSNVHEHVALDGSKTYLSTGNNLVFTGTTTLTDVTGAATITADDWQIVSLNDDAYFFQAGHTPLMFDYSAGTLIAISAHASYAGSVPTADVALAAYGRLWVANTSTDKQTVTYSDLLIGPAWTGGSSGSINVEKYWPNGTDEITGLAAHNGYLLIFGKESIIVYDSADDVTNLSLTDTVTKIGIVGKHAWTNTGSDIMFVDKSGLRSFNRVIQEKSLPIGDVSRNVRRDFTSQATTETGSSVRCVYGADEAFVLVSFPSKSSVWCFDMRALLPDGSGRTTLWTGVQYYTMTELQGGDLYFGTNDGVLKYTGYLDDASTYRYRYYSVPLDFQSTSQLKFPKSMGLTITGGPAQKATAYWGYDYTFNFKSFPFTLDAQDLDFYNTAEDEYNNQGDPDPDDPTEYTGGFGIKRYKIPLTGDGLALTVGLEVAVNNSHVSLQEIDIKTLIGQML